ncbi:Sas10 C-terminal domain-containing protein [Entophlyctis helioformis]|nr:Sas10 C-terminal domain-containing protein [Entophlyctis helioformis]
MARKGGGARRASAAKKGRGLSNAAADDDNLYKKTTVNVDALEGDSEDEFHDQRGRIGLEALKSFKGFGGQEQEDEDEDQDEEVFGLQGVESDEDEDDDEEEEQDEDEVLLDRLRSYGVRPKSETARDESDDDDDDVQDRKKSGRDEDAMGGWGSSRQAYYDADEVSEEEDAKEEEKEALRLQQEQLNALAEDDVMEGNFENLLKKKKTKTTTATAASSDTAFDLDDAAEQIKPNLDAMSESDKQRLAKSSIPEVIMLLNEFKSVWGELGTEPIDVDVADPNSIAQLARYLYLTNLAFYFALAADSDAATRKTHPVVEQLAQLQELVTATATGLYGDDTPISDVASSEDLEEAPEEPSPKKAKKDKKKAKETAASQIVPASDKKARKAAAAAAKEAADIDMPVESYNDVVVPKSSRKRKRTAKGGDEDDSQDDEGSFGEGDDIGEGDLEDKLNRKKSLKFHVNRIDQSITNIGSLKRKIHAAGDDDIPYRDAKAAQAAAVAKAQKMAEEAAAGRAGKGGRGGDDEDDMGDMYEDDEVNAHFGRGDGSDNSENDGEDGEAEEAERDEEGEELYAAFQAEHEKRVAEKRARSEMARAEMEDAEDERLLGEDDKRKATWKILTNKGLTPHRKKIDRNPRVKKRVKYEQAKKKLSSYRRVVVDKSKLGAYAGEATGIKANLSRSVKFT